MAVTGGELVMIIYCICSYRGDILAPWGPQICAWALSRHPTDQTTVTLVGCGFLEIPQH